MWKCVMVLEGLKLQYFNWCNCLILCYVGNVWLVGEQHWRINTSYASFHLKLL